MMAGVPKPCVTNEKFVNGRCIDRSRIGAKRLLLPNGERSCANRSLNSLTICLNKHSCVAFEKKPIDILLFYFAARICCLRLVIPHGS